MSNDSFCVDCFCGDYIIHKKGGHCFFYCKSNVIFVTTRFYIKKKVVKLDTTSYTRGEENG